MKWILRFLLVGVTLGALWLALDPTPPAIPGLDTDPRKHSIGIGFISLLAGLAFPRTGLKWIALAVGTGTFGLELLQGIPFFHRDPDANDWVAGMAGLAISLTILWCWRTTSEAYARRKSNRAS